MGGPISLGGDSKAEFFLLVAGVIAAWCVSDQGTYGGSTKGRVLASARGVGFTGSKVV